LPAEREACKDIKAAIDESNEILTHSHGRRYRVAYDEDLEARIRSLTHRWKHTDSKPMFGGVCHLLHGNMFCGVHKDFLILRLGETAADEALSAPSVRPFDITGKPMKGWVMVEPEGCRTDKQLKHWLQQAKQFAAQLPPK
jgi:hypothetical protein